MKPTFKLTVCVSSLVGPLMNAQARDVAHFAPGVQFGKAPDEGGTARIVMRWLALFFLAASHAMPFSSGAALPSRLVLLLDGVSYRDVRALQEGTGFKAGPQAFREGYFPASRLISTFPSISDPAWSEILGNDPPPGYQRTYFNAAMGSEVSFNGVTSVAEYERQMTAEMHGSFRRVTSYGLPVRAFKYELNQAIKGFLQSSGAQTNYYALIHSTDSAQHLWGDIQSMLCTLDEKLHELRAIYRAREGKELEILILSDHGHNHAGGGKRIAIQGFLKKHGYRVAKSLSSSKDIVLPTAGIESWVEIHNSPSETTNLVRLLSRLEGVDLVTARLAEQTNRFIVRNSKGEQAEIEWKGNSFRYQMETGDPLDYARVMNALADKRAFDSGGFAMGDAWMEETLTHRYPVALERIVRGHAKVALNPASILLSLDNAYVHSGWCIKRGISLVKSGGTHGGLDDVSSTGVLLSSFARTEDTSTSRVAALFDGFKGRRDYRSEERGAEWVFRRTSGLQAMVQRPEEPGGLWMNELFLRIWTPAFARLDPEAPVSITIESAGLPARIRRSDPDPTKVFEQGLVARSAPSFQAKHSGTRDYAIPTSLALQPQTPYRISIWIQERNKRKQIFKFTFRTDSRGMPTAPVVEVEPPGPSKMALKS